RRQAKPSASSAAAATADRRNATGNCNRPWSEAYFSSAATPASATSTPIFTGTLPTVNQRLTTRSSTFSAGTRGAPASPPACAAAVPAGGSGGGAADGRKPAAVDGTGAATEPAAAAGACAASAGGGEAAMPVGAGGRRAASARSSSATRRRRPSTARPSTPSSTGTASTANT